MQHLAGRLPYNVIRRVRTGQLVGDRRWDGHGRHQAQGLHLPRRRRQRRYPITSLVVEAALTIGRGVMFEYG